MHFFLQEKVSSDKKKTSKYASSRHTFLDLFRSKNVSKCMYRFLFTFFEDYIYIFIYLCLILEHNF